VFNASAPRCSTAATYPEIGFSEFETYGNYVETYHQGAYIFRNHANQRMGSSFFGFSPTEDTLQWLACYYDTVSFETWSRPCSSRVSKLVRLKLLKASILLFRGENFARKIRNTIHQFSWDRMKKVVNILYKKLSIY
jgi:hypothetical protein